MLEIKREDFTSVKWGLKKKLNQKKKIDANENFSSACPVLRFDKISVEGFLRCFMPVLVSPCHHF